MREQVAKNHWALPGKPSRYGKIAPTWQVCTRSKELCIQARPGQRVGMCAGGQSFYNTLKHVLLMLLADPGSAAGGFAAGGCHARHAWGTAMGGIDAADGRNQRMPYGRQPLARRARPANNTGPTSRILITGCLMSFLN